MPVIDNGLFSNEHQLWDAQRCRAARTDAAAHSGLLPLPNLADLGLHQPPGSFADRLAPVAIETGIDQPFAEAVDVDRIDDHAPVAKRLLQISICGADEGALLGHVDSCIADDAVLNVGG